MLDDECFSILRVYLPEGLTLRVFRFIKHVELRVRATDCAKRREDVDGFGQRFLFLVSAGHLFVFILSLENEASHEPGDSGDSQSVHAFG